MFGRRSSDPASQPAASAPVKPSVLPKGQDGAEDLEQLWSPAAAKARKSVEQLLLERNHITEEQLTQARSIAAQTPGKSIAQILLTMNSASEAQILSALAETMELEFETPDKANVIVAAFNLLPPDYIRNQTV